MTNEDRAAYSMGVRVLKYTGSEAVDVADCIALLQLTTCMVGLDMSVSRYRTH